ncbi:septal ring lytic transglycosylase RlpA family protein [Neisseriaceae bacterium CLB008]|nr:septal ring lytic transglycosylase RlpA family protein [Neisseriaceae bacterium]
MMCVGLLSFAAVAPAAKVVQPKLAAAAKKNNVVIIPKEPLHRAANMSYKVAGKRYTPSKEIVKFAQEGRASWYGNQFHGRKTTSEEVYNMYDYTAAHPTLPIPSYVKVTNLANNKEVVVRINDRGPFSKSRIIDLSYAAAKKLGYINQGTAEVRIEQVTPGEQIAVNTQDPRFVPVMVRQEQEAADFVKYVNDANRNKKPLDAVNPRVDALKDKVI